MSNLEPVECPDCKGEGAFWDPCSQGDDHCASWVPCLLCEGKGEL